MTFSIVARDRASGMFGVAVSSHWFNVGNGVPWIGGGVGAIAVQAVLGKEMALAISDHLRLGLTAPKALEQALASDTLAHYRQVGVVDANNEVAAHTGGNCIAHASHQVGEGFCVQANMMLNDKVVPAMHRAYAASATGHDKTHTAMSFARRLYATLAAGQEAGGDVRGEQSVALIIAPAQQHAPLLVELHVADHKNPLEELSRLLHLQEAYDLMNLGDSEIAKGNETAAIAAYSAAAKSVPDNLEAQYWHAVTLLNAGQKDEAQKILDVIYDKKAIWREITERLVSCGIIST